MGDGSAPARGSYASIGVENHDGTVGQPVSLFRVDERVVANSVIRLTPR